MFRKKLAAKTKPGKDDIAWRGHEVTRIEAFSDAMFAFGITLLIVSLEVPRSYHELMNGMLMFMPFAICFTIVFMIWYAQNIFFRRYGLHDTTTVVLNGILMFVVLFFIYPLKYLFRGMFSGGLVIENTRQIAYLFYIYSGGFMVIYLLFAAMYNNALRHREALNLTPSELFQTRSHLYGHLAIAGVGMLSIIIAYFDTGTNGWAGLIYFLIGPVMTVLYSKRHSRHRRLFPQTKPVIDEPADDIV